MKLRTGRGIQFFKKPNLSAPKNFIVNTFNASKKQITSAIGNIGKTFAAKPKNKTVKSKRSKKK
jgi:hypothetical protein